MHRSLNDTIVKNLLTFSTHHNYYNVIILSILYFFGTKKLYYSQIIRNSVLTNIYIYKF